MYHGTFISVHFDGSSCRKAYVTNVISFILLVFCSMDLGWKLKNQEILSYVLGFNIY